MRLLRLAGRLTPRNLMIINDYKRLVRLAFPEKVHALDKQDNLRHGRKKSNRTYREKNRELRNQKNKIWRQKNKTRRKQYQARWIKAHSARMCYHAQLRRARKKKAAISDLPQIKKIYARAAELRQWFDVVVDHIIPLAKSGAHSPENLQIIYRKENGEKGIRLDYRPSIVFV